MSRIHKTNMIDHLSHKYGINKTWIAAQLGLSLEAFYYALERGLRDDEVVQLEKSIHAIGRNFINFKLPHSLKHGNTYSDEHDGMFDLFKNKYGIRKTWIAEQLGMNKNTFYYAVKRGFKEAEIEIIESVLQSLGRDLIRFKTPSHIIQDKAAA